MITAKLTWDISTTKFDLEISAVVGWDAPPSETSLFMKEINLTFYYLSECVLVLGS